MIRVRTSLAVAAVVVVLSGCSTEEPRAEVEVLANGATLIRNTSVGAWDDEDGWTLTEDLRIGAIDGEGPDAFGDAGRLSLAVHPDGRIYILDGQAQEIRVFDQSGEHIQTFGRGGAGPGELGWAALAGWGPDGHLWVADPTNNRYSVFSASGEFITSHRRQISFASYPWTGIIDREGRILDTGTHPTKRRERLLIRVEPSSGVADTFPIPVYKDPTYDEVVDGVVTRSINVPFAGQLIWRPHRDGRVWSAVTDRYRLVQQSLSGDTLKIIEGVAAPQPVPDEMKREAREFLERAAAGADIDISRMPEVLPLIGAFAVDDREYLWVSIVKEEPGTVMDVFDPSGYYLGRVSSPVNLRFWPTVPIFQNEYLYAFTTDELDTPSLVRLKVGNRQR